MAEKQVALAVGAHPDDVEFNMAGTLSLLTNVLLPALNDYMEDHMITARSVVTA